MAAVLRPVKTDPNAGSLQNKALGPDDVRVMLVDDSLTVRTVFARMIDRADGMGIVAQASTAENALLTLRNTAVDVVLLDLNMPGMGGLEALPKILNSSAGAQVLVVSSLTQDGAEETLAALSMGAADTMLKPRPGGFNDEYRDSLLAKICALGGKSMPPEPVQPVRAVPKVAPPIAKLAKVVAIGASTGGIHALNLFLRKLPREFDLPILITQHLPVNFMPVFTRQMSQAADREAILAEEGTEVKRGRILIAPGHGHMIVRKSGSLVVTGLTHHPVKSGCIPSVDPMFDSLADVYDGRVAAVLLSGMGRDGTEGAQKIARAGGSIFAQDEASCAVWGMPRAVAESGLACAVLPPEALAEKLASSIGSQNQ